MQMEGKASNCTHHIPKTNSNVHATSRKGALPPTWQRSRFIPHPHEEFLLYKAYSKTAKLTIPYC
jgi:hypothetical protein